jgi:RraA family protein
MTSESLSPPCWPPGYRVNHCPDPLPHDVIAFFRDVPAACVADCMGRSVGTIGLRAYHGSSVTRLCGSAVTVRVRPGDNLMIHKAMLMAQAGDVIAIDGAGNVSQALVGELMRTTALARKLGGFVVDGAVRDVADWSDGLLPIYAKGHTPRGASKDGPGEINVPIACAGLAIQPGDLLVGDEDGVVAIPRSELAALRVRILAHLRRESEIREINAREGGDSERIDGMLRRKGLPI